MRETEAETMRETEAEEHANVVCLTSRYSTTSLRYSATNTCGVMEEKEVEEAGEERREAEKDEEEVAQAFRRYLVAPRN